MNIVLYLALISTPLRASGFAIRPSTFAVRTSGGSQVSSDYVVRGLTALRMSTETEEDVEDSEEDVQEKKRTKAPTWMFNDKGVAYAPWMVDAFDPENLAKVEAAIEARKQAEENAIPEALGALRNDPQQMELSGLGLQTKKLGDSVELIWRTGDESNNVGFIVSRRAAKTDEWVEIASYQDWPPLNSKGPDGGIYSYVDEGVGDEGGWVYRISDVSKSGVRNDLCQTLVELESASNAMQTKIILAVISVAFAAVLYAGTVLDPMQ
ncbi:unnamed protein product [Discosporangium mesarthrocarpum]